MNQATAATTDSPLDLAKLDVQVATELEQLVQHLIERELLTPAYVKAARSLAFNAKRMASARLADTMMDAKG